jgi:Tol biopolymer transport system component
LTHTIRTFLLISAGGALVAAQSSGHLSSLRQLTFGGQNAEAYWSPNGKRLVFQSTREGNACDQIYIMNVDGTNAHLVSTGKGVTTCGYFYPDGVHVLYASTHEGNPACPPRPDHSKGYVWAVYPDFDIYLATTGGKVVRKLTNSPGYDAEATVNWKTGTIVYTSLASGDLDLWTMNLDGSNVHQVTSSLGYDGGGVLSRDGKKLVWRANHPAGKPNRARYLDLLKKNLTSPMKMELFVADSDGRHAKQITSFGCASFAPTFTPDGRKILFASNKNDCDTPKFELFLIDANGGELEQVTHFGGFTAFPEFSPDGRKIAFASDRNAKGDYEFNIFTADWKP